MTSGAGSDVTNRLPEPGFYKLRFYQTNSVYATFWQLVAYALKVDEVVPNIGASEAVGILKQWIKFRDRQLTGSLFIEKTPSLHFLAVCVAWTVISLKICYNQIRNVEL
jgi:hypothetical protein